MATGLKPTDLLNGKPRGAAGKNVVPFCEGTSKKHSKGTLSYSYFLGKGADESKPNNILAGDSQRRMFGKYNNDDDKKAAHIIFKKKFTAKKLTRYVDARACMRIRATSFCPTHPCQQASASKLAQYLIDSSDNDNEMMFPSGK